MDIKKKALALAKKYKGKIEISSKLPVNSKDDLSLIYTPGVAEVSKTIAEKKERVNELSMRGNTIAIVTNGTAVLGLGNTGPESALPVMEGKAVLFKKLAGINAVPLCISSLKVKNIVKFCKQIEPTYSAINLEDVKAPECFDVLEKLEKQLSIPIFHDDQDGTAIAVLAALINAARVENKEIRDMRVVVNGAGAAGLGISKLLLAYGVKNLVLLDSRGIINKERKDLNKYKLEIARITNQGNLHGDLKTALPGADVFIGVSQGNLLTPSMVKTMNAEPIIFALANPVPEIMPDEAKKAGASIVGTGRSDFDNQINNALVFPGMLKGLVESGTSDVDSPMKIKAALSLAYTIKKPSRKRILPGVLNKEVANNIVKGIRKD